MSDIWHYFLGNYRYYFWYGGYWSRKFAFIAYLRKRVIRSHIKEQIEWRIKHMDQECYINGSCNLCGCETTALQMCNKSCDKPCYPPMMTKKQWDDFWNGPWMHLDKYGRLWDKGEGGKPYVSDTINSDSYVFNNTHRLREHKSR